MPNANTETASATRRPRMAAQCALTWKNARLPNSTMIGSAATSVDNVALPSGSYTCDQDIGSSERPQGRRHRNVLPCNDRKLIQVIPSCQRPDRGLPYPCQTP